MFVAAGAENLLRLYDLGCQAVAVTNTLTMGTAARLNKLRCDSQLLEVSLLFDSVSTQDFQKL